MKWYSKLIITLAILLLAGGIAFLGFLLHAQTSRNEYRFQTEAMMAATLVANQGEPDTAPEKSIVSGYEGRRYVIHPENYKKVSFYLQENLSPDPFSRIDKEKALELTFCGEGKIWVQARDADRVRILLETGGKAWRMQARGGNIWVNLLRCCQEGSSLAENILLDGGKDQAGEHK